jgi:hypothetical protein
MDSAVKKFSCGRFFKHERCKDAFIEVIEVNSDDGIEAELKVNWLSQGRNVYWYLQTSTPIKVKGKDYDKWIPCNPKGNTLC